ncbi:MAG: alpha-mannosidase [Bacillota bacterium]
MAAERDTLHVIAHTHWDREWYFTFQQFRYRLVHLINGLLDRLPAQPDFTCFHLDGQTSVIEDYLEVEPDRAAELADLIRAGRIFVGPWYIQPDEFLVSGEALVRNLLRGRATARRFGGSMQVGYMPDMFGHIAQMPQIWAGFGIDNALLWRGVREPNGELRTEWVWRGLDTTEILLVQLPHTLGYFSGAIIPADAAAAPYVIEGLYHGLKGLSQARHLLIMNGSDHMDPAYFLPDVLRAANGPERPYEVKISNLDAYVQGLRDSLPLAELPRLTGELRSTNFAPGMNNPTVLSGVLSTRIYLKQWNERVETLLERWAEPFGIFARMGAGWPYPARLMQTAWKYLLQNQPHDSICGCSVDAVHRQMLTRFAEASEIGETLLSESLYRLAQQINTRAVPGKGIPLVLFNPNQAPADEVVTAQVLFPTSTEVRGVVVTGPDGAEVDAVLETVEPLQITPNLLNLWPPFNRQSGQGARVRFLARNIPAHGYAVYRVEARDLPDRTRRSLHAHAESPVLENGYLRAEIRPDGRIDLTDLQTGARYEGLLAYEDGGDKGDEYSYSEPRVDRIYTTAGAPASISLLERSPLGTAYQVEWEWRLPAGLDRTGDQRAEEMLACRMRSVLRLSADSRRLEVETTFENRVKDHRLRVLVPTGITTGQFETEVQFGVLRRQIPTEQPDREAWIEDEPVTFPQKRFTDVTDGRSGLALLNQGLPEVQALRGERGLVLAMTLLRAVGRLSREKMETRHAENGQWVETPEAQCLGSHTFRFGLMPHAGGWEAGGVLLEAARFTAPLRACQTDDHEGPLSPVHSFLSVSDPRVIISAVKQAEESDSIIVRLYNPTSGSLPVRVGCAWPIGNAWRVDLKEERQEPLPIGPDGCVSLLLPAARILSLEFTSGEDRTC